MNKKQTTHWLKVAVIGIALGFALQFVRAWTEPTEAPPGGNVGAPINTSGNSQTKAGGMNILGSLGIGTVTPANKLDVAGKILATGDICTTVAGTEKCLSTAGGPTGPGYTDTNCYGEPLGGGGTVYADGTQKSFCFVDVGEGMYPTGYPFYCCAGCNKGTWVLGLQSNRCGSIPDGEWR
jgi:hypothetical protein